jgi:hypothetical protein
MTDVFIFWLAAIAAVVILVAGGFFSSGKGSKSETSESPDPKPPEEPRLEGPKQRKGSVRARGITAGIGVIGLATVAVWVTVCESEPGGVRDPKAADETYAKASRTQPEPEAKLPQLKWEPETDGYIGVECAQGVCSIRMYEERSETIGQAGAGQVAEFLKDYALNDGLDAWDVYCYGEKRPAPPGYDFASALEDVRKKADPRCELLWFSLRESRGKVGEVNGYKVIVRVIDDWFYMKIWASRPSRDWLD